MVDAAVPRHLSGRDVSPANSFWREHFVAPVFRPRVPWADIECYLEPRLPAADSAVLAGVLCERSSGPSVLPSAVAPATMSMRRWQQAYLWFGDWFAPDDEGAAARADMLELFREPWFHGAVSLRTAESRLAVRAAGAFLVRLDPRNNCVPFTLLFRDRELRAAYAETTTRVIPITRRTYECNYPHRFCLKYGTATICEQSVPRLVACLASRGILTTPCPANCDMYQGPGVSNPYVPGDCAFEALAPVTDYSSAQ